MNRLIFEKSVKGRCGVRLPHCTPAELGAATPLPESLRATTVPELPEVSELDVVRHYTHLSQQNFSVDTQFYPLGSCTMKYNPRLCEQVSSLTGFRNMHPLLPQIKGGAELSQGTLEVIWRTEQLLCELTGMQAFTMQPMAGAQGELTGMLMIAAYHRSLGNQRSEVLIPDSAHGTNPATAAAAGFKVVTLPTDKNGNVDLDIFQERLTPDVAAVMLTCPNTLGIFEKNVAKMAEMAHANGTLLYYDGANLNALMGRARPGDLGFDVVHLNLHKTLGTPHGGGGPGSGPVGCVAELAPFLPAPVVETGADNTYSLCYDRTLSIGKVAPFYGNFAVYLRAYAYMLLTGGNGLRRATEYAVLNANYLRVKLAEAFEIPFNKICMHEVVISAAKQAKLYQVRALDIAKALIDAGFHPPTVYFPLTVPEAMMIEPTETESKETLDRFVTAMLRIAHLAETKASTMALMPETTRVSRVDETLAAREMQLKA